jgi:hypothetical protein
MIGPGRSECQVYRGFVVGWRFTTGFFFAVDVADAVDDFDFDVEAFLRVARFLVLVVFFFVVADAEL